MMERAINGYCERVLIDTWWNVNKTFSIENGFDMMF
mgnify:CR=1 FL=1